VPRPRLGIVLGTAFGCFLTNAAYERRLGNVLVHYGGGDRRVLARVEAAVAALATPG